MGRVYGHDENRGKCRGSVTETLETFMGGEQKTVPGTNTHFGLLPPMYAS